MAVKCILTGQTPSVLDGVTENIQNQLNSKQDKITVTGFLVGSADGAVTGVEDTFVSYDSLSNVEAASSPNDWHIGDNGNWYFGAMDSGKSSKGTDGAPGSDGYSPSVSVTSTSTGATITITDKTGTTTATVKNGTNGTNGTNGNDGKSAYASAQSGGYTGTESAFNAALAQVENKANQSVSRNITLLALGWNADTKNQTVVVTGLTSTSNGTLAIAPSATDEQWEAWAGAAVRLVSQASGNLTLHATGDIPAVDIPVEVIIL